MNLHGKNFIGGNLSASGRTTFTGIDPATRQPLTPTFHEATEQEVNEAARAAETSAPEFSRVPTERLAGFLEAIAEELLQLGDDLVRRAQAETALPEARLNGERGRTVGQIKMFAELVKEGSWVDASIDRADPERKPLPKPDLRRKLIPVGPVVVFGASNFPLAFSVAGGDTISALAAANPVVFKAHPAHPGTSELVAAAIQKAVEKSGMPRGIFSMIHGASPETGLRLVKQPAVQAVGFTGSLKAGRALFDAAAARPSPIPVYAEMGSTNPVFILPEALKAKGSSIAQGLIQSVTLGVGQFCTNPGLVFALNDGALASFVEATAGFARATAPGVMLYSAICSRYQEGVDKALATPGVRLAAESSAAPKPGEARAEVLTTDSATFLHHAVLQEELFGPATLVVGCASAAEFERIANTLPGQLTATIHGTEQDLAQHQNLVAILQRKVGRLIFNGFPTGVEVCPSMHHGGPYPATTDVHFTSVGTAAIRRFARPVCFQNFPDAALPLELQNKNVRKILRLVDNKWTRDDL